MTSTVFTIFELSRYQTINAASRVFTEKMLTTDDGQKVITKAHHEHGVGVCTYTSRSAQQRPCKPLHSAIYHRQRLPDKASNSMTEQVVEKADRTGQLAKGKEGQESMSKKEADMILATKPCQAILNKMLKPL
ncbi:hypothetical protein DPMN_064310 [Dreissena polymorpha]|uniref:Uncharacterized protein n=1 Tax=Dreissena polymorpha TaxID=45954 RepID=A0A9D4CCZ3_DREPO|nr:hypothetical protein DPMN_064310 [Dreissena polymorpha]